MKIDLETLCFETKMIAHLSLVDMHVLKEKYTIVKCNIEQLIGVEFYKETTTKKKNHKFLKPKSCYYFLDDENTYNSIGQIINQLEKTK